MHVELARKALMEASNTESDDEGDLDDAKLLNLNEDDGKHVCFRFRTVD